MLVPEVIPKYYRASEFRKAIDYIENQVKNECGFRSHEIITNRDLGDENDYCEFECVKCGWRGQEVDLVDWLDGGWPPTKPIKDSCPHCGAMALEI